VKRLFLILAAVAIVAAGCSSGGPGAPAAATVNGTDISMSSFFDDLDAFAQSNDLREALGFSEPFAEGGDANYSTTFTAQVLTYRIGSALVEQELSDRGEAPTEQDLQQAEQTVAQVPGTADLADDVQQRLVTFVASQQALDRTLTEGSTSAVTDEQVRQYYDENIDSFMTNLNGEAACLSHILIAFDPANLSAAEPTPQQDSEALARAEDAVARVRAGEDFAVVATESDDQGSAANGGDIGCIGRGTGYPPEFEEAALTQPLGEVGDPVRSEFGYHVLLVRTRGVIPFEEIEDELRQQLEQQQQQSGGALGAWLQDAAGNADVHVDPRFGTYQPGQGSLVVPPDGPAEPANGLPSLDPLADEMPIEQAPAGGSS
jgi:foldase protein PrsA